MYGSLASIASASPNSACRFTRIFSFVVLLELLGPLLHDGVEERLAALELGLKIDRELADEVALLLDEREAA